MYCQNALREQQLKRPAAANENKPVTAAAAHQLLKARGGQSG